MNFAGDHNSNKTRPATVDPLTERYVRLVRRARAQLAGNPQGLHAMLEGLNRAFDRRAAADKPEPVAVKHVESRVVDRENLLATFRALVRGHLEAGVPESGVLRYSARKRLIQLGESLGISRFECNLQIALALHEARPAGLAALPGGTAKHGVRNVVVIAITQVVVAAGVICIWWWMR